jgi:hypothetical protein
MACVIKEMKGIAFTYDVINNGDIAFKRDDDDDN